MDLFQFGKYIIIIYKNMILLNKFLIFYKYCLLYKYKKFNYRYACMVGFGHLFFMQEIFHLQK